MLNASFNQYLYYPLKQCTKRTNNSAYRTYDYICNIHADFEWRRFFRNENLQLFSSTRWDVFLT